MKISKKSSKGFSLIELLIVVAIILIIAAIARPLKIIAIATPTIGLCPLILWTNQSKVA